MTGAPTAQQAELDLDLPLPDKLPAQVDEYTLRADPDGVVVIRDATQAPVGTVRPDAKGRPLPFDRTGHPMQAFPRLETWPQSVERVIALDRVWKREWADHLRQARRPLTDVAGDTWDRARHIADTGTNYRPHADGTVWVLGETYRQENADFIARNPDRDAYVATQAAGRDAVLAAATGGRVDLLAEHLAVGDDVWGPASPQIAPYGWRAVMEIAPHEHGDGARVSIRAVKGPLPTQDLYAVRTSSFVVRA